MFLTALVAAAAAAVEEDEPLGAGVVLGVEPLDCTFGGKWGTVANCLSFIKPSPLDPPPLESRFLGLIASTWISSSSPSPKMISSMRISIDFQYFDEF